MKDWRLLTNYFSEKPNLLSDSLFENASFPWSPLERLTTEIEQFFSETEDSESLPAVTTIIKNEGGTRREGSLFIQESILLDFDFINKDLKIFIGKGTFVEAGATIKNHCIIEQNCEIRQGAYIRGNVFIGSHSVVGHTTEIKNTIFVRHVEAGHFAYIGDSIVGSYVNLGAGTKVSNLQFRTLKDKKEENFPEIPFFIEGKILPTGLSKFGAIIGDGAEMGCNSVLSPFVLFEPECWVLPNVCVSKGIYKRSTIIRDFSDSQKKKK